MMFAKLTLMFKVEERLQEVRMRTDTHRGEEQGSCPHTIRTRLAVGLIPFPSWVFYCGAHLQAVGSIPWGREHVAEGNLFRTNLGVQGGYPMSLL